MEILTKLSIDDIVLDLYERSAFVLCIDHNNSSNKNNNNSNKNNNNNINKSRTHHQSTHI